MHTGTQFCFIQTLKVIPMVARFFFRGKAIQTEFSVIFTLNFLFIAL